MILQIFKNFFINKELVLSGLSLFALLFGLRKNQNNFKAIIILFIIALIATVSYLIIFPFKQSIAWNGLYYTSDLPMYAKIFLYTGSAFVFVYTLCFYNFYNLKDYEFLILILFAVIGGSICISANHFLTFYLGLELSNLSKYIIVAFKKDDELSAEACMKFFIMGAIASAVMLFGIAFIYAFSGTLSFSSLFKFFESGVYDLNHSMAMTGAFLVIIGMLIKFPVAPFHYFLADVYEGSHIVSATFIASISKLVVFFATIHLLSYPFYGIFTYLRYIFTILGVISMIMGSISALKQTNVFRMIAYSSVANLGILMVAIAMGGDIGLKACIFYIIIYTLSIFGVFFIISWFEKKYHKVQKISDLKGLLKSDHFMGFIFICFVFSLIGIPPFVGFFAKFYVIQSIIERCAYVLATIMVLSSVISAAYYLNLLKIIAIENYELKANNIKDKMIKFYCFILLLITVVLSINPDILLNVARKIAITVLYDS